MKVGDIVRLRRHAMARLKSVVYFSGNIVQVGLIIDCMEMEDGFYEYEVQFEHGREWFSDVELELVK